jgi:hypothetical protein
MKILKTLNSNKYNMIFFATKDSAIHNKAIIPEFS